MRHSNEQILGTWLKRLKNNNYQYFLVASYNYLNRYINQYQCIERNLPLSSQPKNFYNSIYCLCLEVEQKKRFLCQLNKLFNSFNWS